MDVHLHEQYQPDTALNNIAIGGNFVGTVGRTLYGNDHRAHRWKLNQVGFGWEGRNGRVPPLVFGRSHFPS
jgi:hypothetical protein